MKIKYLFSILLASMFLFAGCVKESTDSFDNIKLSKTYLSIPEAGGKVDVTISATESWEFVTTKDWPESSWLSVDKMSGGAGETKVTFSADKTDAGREIELSIQAGNNLQFVRVRQGSMVAEEATCKDVIDGPDGKTYRVKGVCTSIANTEYGNWYLNDGTGELYVYGTLDNEGKTKNFLSLGIEVGDSVTVEGPKLTYNQTIELVDVTVIELKKSLLKLASESALIAKEGGELTVKVAYKGNGVFVEKMDSWISMSGMTYKSGEPSKLEPNPCDTAIVSFNVQANEAADRAGSITFASYSGANSSNVTYTFTQSGAILNVSLDEFIAKEVDNLTLYRISGIISKVTISEQYQNADVTIYDPASGTELLVFRMGPGEGKKIEELGIAVGDLITIVGKRGEYNGSPQMVNGYYESHVRYNVVSIADFLAAAVSTEVTYLVSGEISNIEEVSANYGNATLTIKADSGEELYIYRMKPGTGAEITDYGFEVGDMIAVAGQRGEYKGSPQMVSGVVVSIKKK